MSYLIQGSGFNDGGAGSSSAITPAQVQGAIESATNLQNVTTLLSDIKANLVQQREFGDRLLQDSANNIFILRTTINESTGAISTAQLNLDGTAWSGPAITPPLSFPDFSQELTQRVTLYEALVTVTGFNIGDQLARQVITNKANSAVFTTWFNDTTGTVLASAPVLPAQARPIEDNNNDLLELIATAVASNNFFEQRYRAIVAGAGYSIGDIVVRYAISASSAPATIVTSSWFNLTTGTTLSTAPIFVHLELAGTGPIITSTSVLPFNTASTTAVSANLLMIGATIYNNTNAELFVRLGQTSTTLANWSVRIEVGGYYETPPNFNSDIAIISPATATAGTVQITILTQ